MRKHLWMAAITALSLAACQKQSNEETFAEDAASSTFPQADGSCGIDYREDSLGYALCHLTTAGKESVKSFLENRERVYSFIEKQFDGEHNVLITTLVNEGGLPGTNELHGALKAFHDIHGNTYHPQIYIPYLDELKEAKVLGTGNPIIVPYAGQEPADGEGYTGYFVDDRGELQRIEISIDSMQAGKKEVWVISLNESVNSEGKLDLVESNYTDIPYGGRTNAVINCRIQKMTVKHHKESWVAGKSEVAIRAARWTWNGTSNGGSGSQVDIGSNNTSFDFRGHLIREFKRKEVNNQDEKTIHYTLQTNWAKNNFYSDPVWFGYVIFERDNWPTGLRTHHVNIPSAPVTTPRYWTYRSADDYYSIGTIYNMGPNFWSGPYWWQSVGHSNSMAPNLSGIKFNVQEF